MVCNKNYIATFQFLHEYIFFFIVSDGSNDSGTSSFGSENKNNKKIPLSNIPFIEAIKVKQLFFIYQ